MPAPFEISFITQTFRDVADQDYIAARTLYRVGLDLQFLWAALQAVEKYLKAILLYNGRSARGLRHRLRWTYERVRTIPDIAFDFPSDIGPFIEYIEIYGQNRYLQHPYFTHGEELRQLDRTVWYIRRYCQYLRTERSSPSSGTPVSMLEAEVKRLQSPRFIAKPTSFRILGGYLERVLARQAPLRSQLVWSNEYFGSPRRRASRSCWTRSVSVNPVHFLEPSVFGVLRDRVDFPKPVVEYFAQQADRKGSVVHDGS